MSADHTTAAIARLTEDLERTRGLLRAAEADIDYHRNRAESHQATAAERERERDEARDRVAELEAQIEGDEWTITATANAYHLDVAGVSRIVRGVSGGRLIANGHGGLTAACEWIADNHHIINRVLP